MKKSYNPSWLPNNLVEKIETIVDDIINSFSRIKPKPYAVILSGGWKHGEITLDQEKLKTDFDIAVFSNLIPLLFKKAEQIEHKLEGKHNIEIDIHGIMPTWLGKSKTFEAYKLKNSGIVLSGNPKALERIKAESDNLPKTEAARLLFENLVNRLLSMSKLSFSKQDTDYRIAKSYLYFGEAFLALRSKLAPTYKARRDNFKEISKDLNVGSKLTKRILAGYDIKLDYVKIHTNNINWNLKTARKDCLDLINWFLKDISKQGDEEAAFDAVFEKAKPKRLFNLFLWRRLRGTGLQPKPALINKFTIADLYKIALYHEAGQLQKRDEVANIFFKNAITDKALIRLFKAWPTLTTVEII